MSFQILSGWTGVYFNVFLFQIYTKHFCVDSLSSLLFHLSISHKEMNAEKILAQPRKNSKMNVLSFGQNLGNKTRQDLVDIPLFVLCLYGEVHPIQGLGFTCGRRLH